MCDLARYGYSQLSPGGCTDKRSNYVERGFMYELVVVLVSPEEPDPVPVASAQLAPYVHKDECGSVPCGNGCWWDAVRAGWRGGPGFFWYDRYGEVPVDHPIEAPADEARRAGDIDIRLAWRIPGAIILPDGQLRWVGDGPRAPFYTLRDVARYEDLLREFPDHTAVPMSGRF
jgi:hypothetical protein